ncbi:thiamine biosynthesis protein ThiS [Parageobacillus sp. VR-IP]|jgi:sulfur carrier protein|uniref:Thiazole biosynthesis protein ThiS n=1 Tax=Parageobacillus caldoxylosilyticus NBRC 107762 TaxID=1220594 RepID=A0A023DHK5_9BACL|nr:MULTISPECIES: sulfur carrier protein ThiS [Parageobacillus]MBB3853862.1 sulfur carrier protein [Parageobacillus caldoxylosilyticus]NUK28627.1 thiamine biosynthesis protein ThiS [Parageobacillus sp. VR-IP]QXJ37871.1 Sulfur carrier protein ThiS [Parageobacillus caldoxylosilyticus]BDG34658.1 thiamine biosynthesis protein ThiS [Parageobacillus caldoxylosilyticus]BDG38432.1 thiamine biosynthesis protein ThiS [Parageobacillus caldoxylosilyticus]
MKLIINGESIHVPEQVKTVSDLLAHFQLQNKLAVVEVNLTIIEKSQYDTTTLCDGDQIEIVHFVGGG